MRLLIVALGFPSSLQHFYSEYITTYVDDQTLNLYPDALVKSLTKVVWINSYSEGEVVGTFPTWWEGMVFCILTMRKIIPMDQ